MTNPAENVNPAEVALDTLDRYCWNGVSFDKVSKTLAAAGLHNAACEAMAVERALLALEDALNETPGLNRALAEALGDEGDEA